MTKKRRRAAKKEAQTEASEASTVVDEPASEAKSFGPWLRRQREGRDIELREIAKASKISVRYLEALESNRFESLPAEIFTKGFLRQYAGFVGLDAEEVVNYYLAAKAAADDEKAEEVPDELRLERRRAPSPVPYVLFALVVTALLVAVIWWLSQERGAAGGESTTQSAVSSSADESSDRGIAQETVTEPASPETSSDAATAAPSETTTSSGSTTSQAAGTETAGASTDDAAAAAASSSPISLVLDFSAECWVEASIDGQPRIAEMHVQGESLRLNADERIDLMVGNIEAVGLELNGRAWQPPGSGGPVRRLSIDLSTINPADSPADPRPSSAAPEGAP